MFQPIPPIAFPPPAAVAQKAAPGGVDVATGPLPQTSASDAVRFSDAIRAGNVEDVARQRAQPGSRVWADAGRSLGGTLSGISAQDVTVRKIIHDRLSSPEVGQGRHGESGGDVDATDGLPQDPQALLQLEIKQNEKLVRDGFVMAQFSVTAEFVSHAGQETEGAVKQLANGGAG